MRLFCILLATLCLHLTAEEPFVKIEDTSTLKMKTLLCETAKIKLQNGLNVYLISNSKAEKSAAALMVKAGSWQDPEEYPGMAHFVEHMLFKGTTAYPEENDYFRFIMENGGTCNAFTMPYMTCYSFAINHVLFEKTLDRFSYFFISPLFSASAVNRELHAVDEEHLKNVEDDNWRSYQILKETGNPDHPNAKFSTGTAATLGRIPLETLKSWYAAHYSANVMTLVIYSNLSIDKLTQLVVDKFKNIKNNNVKPLQISQELSSQEQRGHFIYIKPVQEQKILNLTWELPKKFIDDDSKSLNLIAYTLQRGQKYSLAECLKKENMIVDDIAIDITSMGNHNLCFSLELKLTDYGLKNIHKVLEMVFATLTMLQDKNIPLYLFNEMNTINKIQYEYAEEVDGFAMVTANAAALATEELSSYPDKSLIAKEYDLEKLRELLSCLNPETCQYYLVADPKLLNVVLDKKEEWMQGEYTIKPLDEKLLTALKKPTSCAVQIPLSNIYMPQNLDIKKPILAMEGAKKIVDSDKEKIFYYPSSFPQPKCTYKLRIQSPLLNSDSKSQILQDIFLKAVEQNIATEQRAAMAAGITTSLINERFSLILNIMGFEEKVALLLDNMLPILKQCIITEEQFKNICQGLKEEYQNMKKELPLRQALDDFTAVIKKEALTSVEKEEAIDKITFAEFNYFTTHLFDTAYVEGILCSTLDEKDINLAWEKISRTLNYKPFTTANHFKKEILNFDTKKMPAFIVKNSEAQGTGIILCVDQGDYTFKNEAAQQIASQIMWEAFFTELRSKQKVAYMAHAAPLEIEKRLFSYFVLQASSHDAYNLLTRMDIFLDDFIQEIATNISESRFEEVKQSTITTFSLPPKNIKEMGLRQFNMAFEKGEDFAYYEKRIQAVKDLSYGDFITFCKESLSSNNLKRMAVAVSGKLHKAKTSSYHTMTALELKKEASYIAEEAKLCEAKK